MKRILGTVLANSLAFTLIASTSGVIAQTVKTANGESTNSAYGNLPLSFEANQGQADSAVQYLSHGQGHTLYLLPGEAVLALQGHTRSESNTLAAAAPTADPKASDAEMDVISVIRMQLEGADLKAAVSHEDRQETRTNYFIGSDPRRWHTDIANYARVRYHSIYPGIDLVYYGNERNLEYDFVVSAGASAAPIRLNFSGQSELSIDASGDLVLQGTHGSATVHRPIIYQINDGKREPVAGGFHLGANSTVGFAIGAYDHKRPLVIDPVLAYSTYIGGSGGSNGINDQANGIAVDTAGNAYIVGSTVSTDFPVTTGSFQQQNLVTGGTRSTVFVSKLNSTGTGLVYSTFLGGSGSPAINGQGDMGYGIALDAANNAYVVGATQSSDFPVTCDALQVTTPGRGGLAGFVTKINAAGNNLIYSTYLGGDMSVIQAIAVNNSGNAYVTGYTDSITFPVTSNSFQPLPATHDLGNAFVTELNQQGSGLVYSTYLGGSGGNGKGDFGNAIAIDASGDAFVAGSTYSADFPVTSGAFQTSNVAALSGFVTELNPAGTKEIYSTYLGGSHDDVVNAIAVDSNGFAYVAGHTDSVDFPLTAGVEGTNSGDVAYYTQFSLIGQIGFATKLSQDGSSLVYSTFVEGEGHNNAISGIAVDSTGAAYLTGTTLADNTTTFGGFVTTPGALTSPASGAAAFLVKLDPTASFFNYASMVGNGFGTAVALDASGNAYLTGGAFTNLPISAGAYQGANNAAAQSAASPFVTKLSLSAEANQTTYFAPPANNVTPADTVVNLNCSNYRLVTSTQCEDFVDYSLDCDIFIDYNLNEFSPFVPTGTVTFTYPVDPPDGGTASTTYDIDGGSDHVITIQGSLPPGVYPQVASYSGDVNFKPSSVTTTFDYYCPGPPPIDGNQGTRRRVGSRSLSLPLLRRNRPPVLEATQWHVPSQGGGAKFELPAAVPLAPGQSLQREQALQPQTSPACIAPPAPFTVSPTSLSFTDGQGETSPLPRTITISNPVGATNWTATTTQPWLSVDPTSGTAPGTLRAIVNIGSLTPGTYYDTINIAANGQTSPVNSVPVTLVIQAVVAAPVFTPPAGTYTTPQMVTLTDATPNVYIIRYTTDGSNPTNSSSSYSSPISVTAATETIKAFAVANGLANSPVVSATYLIHPPAPTPTISPAAGTYTTPQTVTIVDSTPGTIYYTLDGTAPTNASARYTGAIAVRASETINAVAYAPGLSASPVATAAYVIHLPATAAPTFSLAAGTYITTQSVKLADTTASAAIYYTTDGTAPTASSTRYSAPITVSASETLRAIAIAPAHTTSAIASAAYAIHPPAAMPVLSVPGGSYTTKQVVTITDADPGTIYYTVDGSTPTNTSPRYTGAITVRTTETLKAVAFGPGFSGSPIASATYTISAP